LQEGLDCRSNSMFLIGDFQVLATLVEARGLPTRYCPKKPMV